MEALYVQNIYYIRSKFTDLGCTFGTVKGNIETKKIFYFYRGILHL